MQPSWLHLFTTSFYGGLEIMNPEMDEDPRNFLDVVAATDPWLPLHSLISQPEAASFRPLPFNGSSIETLYTGLHQWTKQGILVHWLCTCIAKYGFSV